jgi:hypothetical protein
MDSLAEPLRATRLSDQIHQPESLPFGPGRDSGLSEEALYDIPRYLFRAFSPRSVSETTTSWGRSKAALPKTKSSNEDVFLNLDQSKRNRVARMLNLHL